MALTIGSGITFGSGIVLNPPSGPSTIGQEYGGGYYAGQISTTGNGIATHYLIVAPKASGQSTKTYRTSNQAGPTSYTDGPANTAAMNNSAYPAAQFCKGLTIGGYTDWYMPANLELEICYYNLKPTSTSNTTSNNFANNSLAVPVRTSYSAGTPPRTSVAAFQSGGAEAFNTGGGAYFWTSTDASDRNGPADAYILDFSDGNLGNLPKTQPGIFVRAVRRIPI